MIFGEYFTKTPMKIKELTEAYCGALFRQLDISDACDRSELDGYFYSDFYFNNLLDVCSTYVSLAEQ
jgi:hypothetical protein